MGVSRMLTQLLKNILFRGKRGSAVIAVIFCIAFIAAQKWIANERTSASTKHSSNHHKSSKFENPSIKEKESHHNIIDAQLLLNIQNVNIENKDSKAQVEDYYKKAEQKLKQVEKIEGKDKGPGMLKPKDIHIQRNIMPQEIQGAELPELEAALSTIHIGVQVLQKEDIESTVVTLKSILIFTEYSLHLHLFCDKYLAQLVIKYLKRSYHYLTMRALISIHSYQDRLAVKVNISHILQTDGCSTHPLTCMILRITAEPNDFRKILLLHKSALMMDDISFLWLYAHNSKNRQCVLYPEIDSTNQHGYVNIAILDFAIALKYNLLEYLTGAFLTGTFSNLADDEYIFDQYYEAKSLTPARINCGWNFATRTSSQCSVHEELRYCPDVANRGINAWFTDDHKSKPSDASGSTSPHEIVSNVIRDYFVDASTVKDQVHLWNGTIQHCKSITAKSCEKEYNVLLDYKLLISKILKALHIDDYF